MVNIYEHVSDTLSTLGYPVREQGTYLSTETLPDTFITYQLIESKCNSFADNLATSKIYLVRIVLYSQTQSIKQGADEIIRSVMVPANFKRVNGSDSVFGVTLHYAFATDYIFYDMED